MVVLGGTGFVGSRVVGALKESGATVVSVSKSGGGGKGAAGVEYVAADLSRAGDEAVAAAMEGADAVVSCIGVIGGSNAEMEEGNGALNENAAAAAKAAGVQRFVYVSVAGIVSRTVTALPGGLLKGYFDGKARAEAAVEAAVPEPVMVCPSFIYGGEDFEIAPPRVPAGYGGAIEKLLGSAPIKSLAGVMPGPIALTLAPPVSAESVGKACAAAALGQVAGTKFDGTGPINAAAASFAP